MGRFAEAALVVGVDGNAPPAQPGTGRLEGVRVVVEAVQRQNHRLGRILDRQPGPQGQLGAVLGDHPVAGQNRRARARSRGHARRAAGNKRQREAEQERPAKGHDRAPGHGPALSAGLWVSCRKMSSRSVSTVLTSSTGSEVALTALRISDTGLWLVR